MVYPWSGYVRFTDMGDHPCGQCTEKCRQSHTVLPRRHRMVGVVDRRIEKYEREPFENMAALKI
jgi:hypothetical protein